jgi:hypothetical protein
VERGSFFMQASLDEIAGRTSGVEGFVVELVEVLRAKGVLADDDLRRSSADKDADTAPAAGTAPEAGPVEGAKSPNWNWALPTLSPVPRRHSRRSGLASPSVSRAMSWPRRPRSTVPSACTSATPCAAS